MRAPAGVKPEIWVNQVRAVGPVFLPSPSTNVQRTQMATYINTNQCDFLARAIPYLPSFPHLPGNDDDIRSFGGMHDREGRLRVLPRQLNPRPSHL